MLDFIHRHLAIIGLIGFLVVIVLVTGAAHHQISTNNNNVHDLAKIGARYTYVSCERNNTQDKRFIKAMKGEKAAAYRKMQVGNLPRPIYDEAIKTLNQGIEEIQRGLKNCAVEAEQMKQSVENHG